MHRSLPLALALTAVLAACASSPTAVDPRDITFAPELGIDLDAMTRTASGLYYLDLEEGTGTRAQAGRWVSVLYRGWLPDGTLFDESSDPQDPLVFRLGAGMVIRGWDEGVNGMRVGGTRLLVIPPSLGYGNQATGPIPANSVLVFEVRLLGVN